LKRDATARRLTVISIHTTPWFDRRQSVFPMPLKMAQFSEAELCMIAIVLDEEEEQHPNT
jgi:hypothetical protein